MSASDCTPNTNSMCAQGAIQPDAGSQSCSMCMGQESCTLSVVSYVKTAGPLVLISIAQGYPDDPPVPLSTSGYVHPKVLHVPDAWNGYTWWMAITPFYGPLRGMGDGYENPTIFASNDGILWEEPVVNEKKVLNPLDRPSSTDKYNSDTHLALGDDGYLYVFYRTFSDSYIDIYSMRSSDGVTWSARNTIFSTKSSTKVTSVNFLLSPCFAKTGDSQWSCLDLIRSVEPQNGLFIAPQRNMQNTFLFRRDSHISLDSGYGEYDENQMLTLSNNPWGDNFDLWHLDYVKTGNLWLYLFCISQKNEWNGTQLWLAYSFDGVNIKTFTTPLESAGTYRSTIVPVSFQNGVLTANIYEGNIEGSVDGQIWLYTLKLQIT